MAEELYARLLEELDRAGESLVQAIVQIRSPDEPKTVPSPEEAIKLANSVLDRVAASVGCSANKTNILRNLATIVVEAPPAFIRSLIKQPEVISVIPNQTAESPFILPKRKRQV